MPADKRDASPTIFSQPPTVAGSYVFVDVNSKVIEAGKDIPYARIAAYRVSPDGAEHAWSMPDNRKFWFGNHMDSVARRRMTVGDGLLYFTSGNKAGGAMNYTFSILRVRDGKVLLEHGDLRGKPALMYRVEDRLLYIADPAHKDRLKIQIYTAAPASSANWTASGSRHRSQPPLTKCRWNCRSSRTGCTCGPATDA